MKAQSLKLKFFKILTILSPITLLATGCGASTEENNARAVFANQVEFETYILKNTLPVVTVDGNGEYREHKTEPDENNPLNRKILRSRSGSAFCKGWNESRDCIKRWSFNDTSASSVQPLSLDIDNVDPWLNVDKSYIGSWEYKKGVSNDIYVIYEKLSEYTPPTPQELANRYGVSDGASFDLLLTQIAAMVGFGVDFNKQLAIGVNVAGVRAFMGIFRNTDEDDNLLFEYRPPILISGFGKNAIAEYIARKTNN